MSLRLWLPDLPEGGWKRVVLATGSVTLLICILAVSGRLFANILAGRETELVDILTHRWHPVHRR